MNPSGDCLADKQSPKTEKIQSSVDAASKRKRPRKVASEAKKSEINLEATTKQKKVRTLSFYS
jgi:hypothetical protein